MILFYNIMLYYLTLYYIILYVLYGNGNYMQFLCNFIVQQGWTLLPWRIGLRLAWLGHLSSMNSAQLLEEGTRTRGAWVPGRGTSDNS